MEELKDLIHAIAGLPTLTVWILVGYLVYKLAIVGSMYGVIRYAIQQFVVWRTGAMTRQFKMGSRMIDESVAELVQTQIIRLCSGTGYIHASDAMRLKKAIDLMFETEAKK
jgi:hypothetical protein